MGVLTEELLLTLGLKKPWFEGPVEAIDEVDLVKQGRLGLSIPRSCSPQQHLPPLRYQEFQIVPLWEFGFWFLGSGTWGAGQPGTCFPWWLKFWQQPGFFLCVVRQLLHFNGKFSNPAWCFGLVASYQFSFWCPYPWAAAFNKKVWARGRLPSDLSFRLTTKGPGTDSIYLGGWKS